MVLDLLLARVRPKPHLREEGRSKHGSTAPFRSDVEGLRAIAVSLVLLYHAHFLGLRGGYVGVDVFFVLSGFLITRLLVDAASSTKTARHVMLQFYARRIRRLLPLSCVVLLVTLWCSYHWLGFLRGNSIAQDTRWSSVFLANIHFGRVGTDYLGSQSLPSPIQHFWSLAVEEQFYLVWPALVLLLVRSVRSAWRQSTLRYAFGGIAAVSFMWCLYQTRTNGTWAYFSPATRTWELAVGALVAVESPRFARLPRQALVVVGWLGLAVAVTSAFVFGKGTSFPGSAAGVPVLGTAMVLISGGTANPVVSVLSLRPLQWLGKISYSLYLWHWPLLIIAEGHQGSPLSAPYRVLLLVGAVLISIASYHIVENPVRNSKYLAARPLLTLGVGLVLIETTVVYASHLLAVYSGR
jgi:peptidoglycan/LPS O-acetylase OafA/YrhL